MNSKHSDASIKISKEPCGLFVSFCVAQGCLWIGTVHTDERSARREGVGHLEKFRPKPITKGELSR